MNERPTHLPFDPTMAQLGFVWFLRLVSIYCLVAGVGYWAQLSGYYEGLLWRFDLMPWQWKVASVSLAMLYPVASTGLWMMVSWGPVIWFVAALGETLMFTVFSNYFFYRPQIAVVHGCVALLYICFRAVLFLQKRQQAKPVR
ncbi:DUF6163 family protein [Phyllobacterium zundukense]|uniref:Transmemrbane protein n=1 Tax=Phyllobacterium zundukense TaxID=1867719 RepID=A0A2N9W3X8_9HYPH|nr:DUF6163 family protein [Phyllobacterium zundukense]ATU92080.1 hypothetical protein BLM14_10890 [Phyllobacterium zundukense]PIO46446.1 hypothetical protein B5P45_01175 [Phyllobacterium zundukense]